MKPALFLFVALVVSSLRAVSWPQDEDPRLIPVYHAEHVWNSIATTNDGRAFVGFPRPNNPGVQLAEMTGPGAYRVFPDATWNSWKPGDSLEKKFVHVNAIRIGPDGKLWVVDSGATGIGDAKAVPGGARAIRIDLATNRVDKIYDLRTAVTPKSYIDDMRFNGNHAYFTDAGAPGVLTLNLTTGFVFRIIDNDPTTIDSRSLYADGKILRDKQGKELRVHADQLEVSPDGKWLYYQPCGGPLARIETDPLDRDGSVDKTFEPPHTWLDTPTTGGTAIDADGNIYYGDANNRSILKITPNRKITTLIADSRLIWSDAMWI